MKVSQVKDILNNKKMANLETNFKVKKPGTNGGGPRCPRKPPKWFIDFKKENDARWAKQEEINRKPPKYFIDFANQMLEFVKEQKKFNHKQEQFNKQTNKKFELIFSILERNNIK